MEKFREIFEEKLGTPIDKFKEITDEEIFCAYVQYLLSILNRGRKKPDFFDSGGLQVGNKIIFLWGINPLVRLTNTKNKIHELVDKTKEFQTKPKIYAPFSIIEAGTILSKQTQTWPEIQSLRRKYFSESAMKIWNEGSERGAESEIITLIRNNPLILGFNGAKEIKDDAIFEPDP